MALRDSRNKRPPAHTTGGAPAGFVKDASFGFGLEYNYRFVIEAIERIPEIKHLVISWESGKLGIDEEFYYLGVSVISIACGAHQSNHNQ